MKDLLRSTLVAAVALLLAAPAAGAADWREGGVLTDPNGRANPLRLAVGGSGDAAFAWAGYSDLGFAPVLRARPRGGPLGNPVRLSEEYEGIQAYANEEDDLLLVSSRPIGPQGDVVVRSGNVRGELAPEETLRALGPSERLCVHAGAVGPSGRAIVLYGIAPPWGPSPFSADADRCSLRMRFRPSRDAEFGPEQRLTDETRLSPFDLEAVFDSSGRAIVVWKEEAEGNAMRLRSARVHPETGAAERQDVSVPGTTPALSSVDLHVTPNGRAVIAFEAVRPSNRGTNIAAATGDTTAGFGDAEVLSGPAFFGDAAIGDDGTVAVVWRAGRNGSAKVQGAIAGEGEPLTADRTQTLSRDQARGAAVAVGGRRAVVAWFRLIPGIGRSVEASSARPGERFARARRISSGVAAARRPEVEVTRAGAGWFSWGERVGPSKFSFRVLKARKLTLATGRFSRVLDVLRGRSGESIPTYAIERGAGESMLAVVERLRAGEGIRPSFWQLRTYGE